MSNKTISLCRSMLKDLAKHRSPKEERFQKSVQERLEKAYLSYADEISQISEYLFTAPLQHILKTINRR